MTHTGQASKIARTHAGMRMNWASAPLIQRRHELVVRQVSKSHFKFGRDAVESEKQKETTQNFKSRAVWPEANMPVFLQPRNFRLSLPSGVGVLDNQQTEAKVFKDDTSLDFFDANELSINSALWKDRDLELYRPACDASSERAIQGLFSAVRSSERTLLKKSIPLSLNYTQTDKLQETIENVEQRHQQPDEYLAVDCNAIEKKEQEEGLVSTNIYCWRKAYTELKQFCGRNDIRIQLHDQKKLLHEDLGATFAETYSDFRPRRNVECIITVAFKTDNDMSGWDDATCEERERKMDEFTEFAKSVCSFVAEADHTWANFIDPRDGLPWFDKPFAKTVLERDVPKGLHPGYNQLQDITIDDAGCCPVLSYNDFKRNVFVGTIVTNAPLKRSRTFQELREINMKAVAAMEADH